MGTFISVKSKGEKSMKLSNESKTLFIPLYGRAITSKKGLFLNDSKALEIVEKVDFDFANLKLSKWLMMYMAVRALVMDEICNRYIREKGGLVVVHLGCGLDSRCLRVEQGYDSWYDIDYPSVIELRKQFYQEDSKYKMIGKSVMDLSWLKEIKERKEVLIVAEGLTMYLEEEELKNLVKGLEAQFGKVSLLFDAYSKKAVRASKYKNPVNRVEASIKWGMSTPLDFLKFSDNLVWEREYSIKHREDNLKGLTKFIFEKLYCGKIAESYYKIYEFRLK